MPNTTTSDTAWCAGCNNLLARTPTDKAKEAIVAATEKHRTACASAGELIAAIRYASSDNNDDPDPAAVVVGAVTAYLEHHHPALFDELGTERLNAALPKEEK